MIKIIALLCHLINGVQACVEEEVTNPQFSQAYAGTVDNPIPMPPMTKVECEKHAQVIVADWMRGHPVFHSWTASAIKCARGDAPLKGRA